MIADGFKDKYARYRSKNRERRRIQSAEWWAKNGAEYREKNRDKQNERQAAYRAANRDVVRARVSAWRSSHPERQRAAEVAYRKNNPDKRKASCSAYRSDPENRERERKAQAAWAKKNKGRLAARAAKRRAVKLLATPSWVNWERVASFYEEAQRLSVETGIEHHVDHMVPLQSKFVCGLHWEANLQILAGPANLSKGNRLWPDMP